MSRHRASVRYAIALLGIATEKNEIEAVDRDLSSVESVFRASPEFAAVLRSPVVSKERKKRLFAGLFPNMGKATSGFISLLTVKGRESLLPHIIEQFRTLRDSQMGIVRASARSAVALTAEQKDALARRLGEATGKKVSVEYQTDPALVGGFTVQFGDTVLDASVRRQLELLADALGR